MVGEDLGVALDLHDVSVAGDREELGVPVDGHVEDRRVLADPLCRGMPRDGVRVGGRIDEEGPERIGRQRHAADRSGVALNSLKDYWGDKGKRDFQPMYSGAFVHGGARHPGHQRGRRRRGAGMESETTIVDRGDGLVVVTFNRPDKMNALNSTNWHDLDRVLAEVENDPADRALVLTGAGGNFSSGADLTGGDALGLTGHGLQPIVHEMRAVGRIISRLQRLPKPTIAAVDGYAIGVALGLVLACDLVIASDRARFTEVFVKRGLALDGGASWSLPRQVGLRRAKQLTFFGDPLDAHTAYDWGLVNEVVPPQALQETALAWGRRLAGGPTTALSLIKRLLDAGVTSSFDEALENEARGQHIAYTTSDMAEGMKAYLERRDPQFKGV
jgi:2-(1,2-epoxy-1,2-dihydrophenyl)acetyl-CoA isomerase